MDSGLYMYSTRQKKLDGSNGTCKVSNGNVTLLLRYSKVTGKLLESYLKVTAKLLESYLNVTPAVHMTCVARGYKVVWRSLTPPSKFGKGSGTASIIDLCALQL